MLSVSGWTPAYRRAVDRAGFAGMDPRISLASIEDCLLIVSLCRAHPGCARPLTVKCLAQADRLFEDVLRELKPTTIKPVATTVTRLATRLDSVQHDLGLPLRISHSLTKAERDDPAFTIIAPVVRELESLTSWFIQYQNPDPHVARMKSSFPTRWYTALSEDAMVKFCEVHERLGGGASQDGLRELMTAALAVNTCVSRVR